MNACELYKDQEITIKINGNIYYGPIKRMYQTFNERVVDVFYNGNWYPAKIIGEAKEKDLIIINDSLICSNDLKLKTPNGDKRVNEFPFNSLSTNIDRSASEICINTFDCKHVAKLISNFDKIIHNVKVSHDLGKSDWLFGIEFIDPNNTYFTLTNGMIISTR